MLILLSVDLLQTERTRAMSSSLPSPVRRTRCNSRRVHLWIAYAGALPILLTASTGMAYRLARTLGAEKTDVKWLMELHSLSIIGLGWLYPLLLASLVSLLVLTGFAMTCIWSGLASLVSRRRSSSRNLHSEVARFEARGGVTAGLVNGADAAASSEEESEASDDESGAAAVDYSFLDRRVPNPAAWTFQQRLQSWLPRAFTWRWLHRLCGTAVFVPFAITAVTGALYALARDWLFLEKSQYSSLMSLHEGRWLEKSGTAYVALLGTSVLALGATGAWMLVQRSDCFRALTRSFPSTGPAKYSAVPVPGAAPAFNQPSANTLARIQRAFDIDHAADETEDESVAGSPAHAQ